MNAILVMCHKDFDQVKRLINRCISNETRIIVHIDKKSNITNGEIEEMASSHGVYLTDERLNGFLDDRSLVDITMLMIDKAHKIEKQENIHFQYYCLLSGQDYLTKHIDDINDRLSQAYPKPIIDCSAYQKNLWIYNKFTRNPFTQSINKWIRFKFKKHNIIWMGFKGVEIFIRKLCQSLSITDYHYFKRKRIDLFGGSAWWILPDIAIDYISKEYNAGKRHWKRLLSSVTPEEVFFQTLVMQSPLANLVDVNPKGTTTQNCKTWAYFFDEDKPPINHPYIFTVKEFDKLVNKDCWFARKFDMSVDSEIFDLLDKHANEYYKNKT